MEEGKKISQLPASLAFLGSMELEVNHNGVSEKVTGDQINAFVGGLSPVTSVFGRIGDVVAQAGDYNTDQITEATAKFWTNARTINSTLTGYAAAPGVISAADTVLSAIQKLSGNIASVVSSSYTVAGTLNRISISGTNPRVIDIDAAYVGQASITTVGIVTTGTWRGTPVQVGFGGTGTNVQFTPGSIVFAGVSGVYTQDNANFRYDDTHNVVLLNGATYSGAQGAIIIGGSGSNGYGVIVEGIGDVSYISTITNNSTSYPTSATGHHASYMNTSTTPGSGSIIRFLNNSASANLGTLYVDGSSSDFFIALAKTGADVTHSTFYIKGSNGGVGIGFDLKAPTAYLHLSGANINQSSLRIGDATVMPTGSNRRGGDINYRTSTGRYYGYKTDNTAEETFAFLSDITGGSLVESAVAFGSNTNTITSDVTNFYYDLNSKTLKLKALEINASSGFSAIVANGLDTVALDITGEVGGIKILNKSAAQYGISIISEGDGVISSVKTGLAGDFSGEATVSTFTQKGKITVAFDEEIVGIYRVYDQDSSALGTGSMLYFNDDTISTSHFIQGIRSSVINFTVANGGFLGLGNVTPNAMITMNGSTAREIKVDYQPTAATAGVSLTITSGSAAIGATNVASGNLILSTGSSRGTGAGNILFYTTTAGSSGSGENAATAFAIFKGDGRIGLNGITLPAAYLTMQAPNGSYGFNILGKELTASNGYDTGWGMRPATNGITTNLTIYELAAATFTNIMKLHGGGGISIGYAGTAASPARIYVAGSSTNTTIGTPNTAQHVGILNTSTTANNYVAYAFYASNSSTAEVLNGAIYGVFTDHTAGTEDMDMRFATIASGAYAERFRMSDIGASIFHISGQRITVGGTIFTSLDSIIGNNIGASETDMASYTTPVNLLAINGDRIKFTIGIQCNNSAVTKTIKVYFKGNVIFNTGALTNPGLLTGYIVIEGIIERYSNTGVFYSVRSVHTALSTSGNAETEFITGMTALNGSTSLFKVTGTATTNNDIELIQSVGEFLPAKQP
jgi:hypothetical protein